MLYYRQVPNLSQTNLNEICASQTSEVDILTYWGGPLWRDRFLLWFLDPKLVPRKITFFHPLEEQKVGKASEI